MAPLFAVLLALRLVLPAAARERVCVPGTPVGCDDHDPCTDDLCDALVCVHTPGTGASCNDRDACTENDRCEAGTCVGTPRVCDDDGLSCTDDVCLGGECRHVPVDSRCVPENSCTSSVCAPGHAGRPPSGCVAGPPQDDGQECAEDGDACTSDVCGEGRCAHQQVLDQETCGAVEGVFRQALALESVARELQAVMVPGTPGPVLSRLAGIDDALRTTARILSGKDAADATSSRPGGLRETPLQQRARLALGVLVRARPQIVAFVRAVGGPPVRAEVSDLGRRGRALLRGARALRAELRRLRAVRSTFVR